MGPKRIYSTAFPGHLQAQEDVQNKMGEERKLRHTYDSNAKTLSFCMMISLCKSFDEKNTKIERIREQGKLLLPMHRVQLGCLRPHTRTSCCSNCKQFITAAGHVVHGAMQGPWKTLREVEGFLIGTSLYSDVCYTK